jgi:hypothetical protein
MEQSLARARYENIVCDTALEVARMQRSLGVEGAGGYVIDN